MENTNNMYSTQTAYVDVPEPLVINGLASVPANSIDLSMKYFKGKQSPFICIMTNSTIYKRKESMNPVGIVWNTTGENRPYLRDYVQPIDGEIEQLAGKIVKTIGLNDRGNDYNHTLRRDGYNAWIGRDKKGNVMSIQTLPWTIRAAGCGQGPNGSADNGWIQINICEDALNDKNYFYAVYNELIHLTAYLCELYDIDPFGEASINNDFSDAKYPTIMDHQEAYKLGIATPRTDVFHWFKKYDKNMRKGREDVARLIQYSIDPYENLSITQPVTIEIPEETFEEIGIIGEQNIYQVKVAVPRLNVRQGPGANYEIVNVINKDTILTIYELYELDNWGKISDTKDQWVDLQYTEPLE